jgi:hypothetical protein
MTNNMTTRELARHIYLYSQNCKSEKSDSSEWTEQDDIQVINYISHLMELHFDPDNHLGSKGFQPTSMENRLNFGC